MNNLSALRQDRARLVQTLVFAGLAAFFIWRAVSLQLLFHVVLSLAFIGFTGLVLFGKLAANWRSNLLNLGISVVFLDLVFAQIPLAEVGDSLLEANWWLMIPSVGALMIHLVFRIWRWQWLLKPIAEIPFGVAWRAGMIGIGGNMVLPARAGEFLRAYAVGRSTGISKTGAFATVVVERIFDGLTVLLFLVVLVIFIGIQDPRLQQAGIFGGLFFFIAMSGAVLFMLRRAWFEAIVERVLPQALAQRVLNLMRSFAVGLEVLRNGRQLAVISVMSIIAWVFVVLSFWPVLLAFDFHTAVPFFAAALSVPMVALGLTIPAAPGGLGIFHAAAFFAVELSFQVVGMPLPVEYQAVLAACTVMLHMSQALPEALLGIWCFYAEGLTRADLQAGQQLGGTT